MGGTVVAHGPGIQLRTCSYPYTYTRPVPRMDGVGFPPLQAALYEAKQRLQINGFTEVQVVRNRSFQ